MIDLIIIHPCIENTNDFLPQKSCAWVKVVKDSIRMIKCLKVIKLLVALALIRKIHKNNNFRLCFYITYYQEHNQWEISCFYLRYYNYHWALLSTKESSITLAHVMSKVILVKKLVYFIKNKAGISKMLWKITRQESMQRNWEGKYKIIESWEKLIVKTLIQTLCWFQMHC